MTTGNTQPASETDYERFRLRMQRARRETRYIIEWIESCYGEIETMIAEAHTDGVFADDSGIDESVANALGALGECSDLLRTLDELDLATLDRIAKATYEWHARNGDGG